MTGGPVDVRIARLAAPESVLGLLQRGRGEGFLAALDMPSAEAAELVWRCIVHDPRYDLQIESRDVYYARLARQVGLHVDRLRPQNCPTPAADVDQRLIVGVLGELVGFGVDRAGDVLIDHVANGEQWDDAIYEISRWSEDLCLQLPAVLERRFEAADCETIVFRWRREVPWDQFARDHAWVQRAIDSFDGERRTRVVDRTEPPAMDRPAAELLAHQWHSAMPKRLLHRLTVMLRDGERDDLVAALAVPGGQRWVAFQALALLDDAGGAPVAEKIIRAGNSGRDRAEAFRYMKNLSGEHTLRLARSWVNETDGRGWAAAGILERHAEESDLPLLLERLDAAWKVRDFYQLCSYIDALARLSEFAPFEPIAMIDEEAEYSYARCRAARALVAIDRQLFADRYARSALWDSEREIQDLAIGVLGDSVDEAARTQISVIERQHVE